MLELRNEFQKQEFLDELTKGGFSQKMKLAWKDDCLKSLIKEKKCIDKTTELEKGIKGFSSIYIEGAAASGKTMAIQMLLSRHTEIIPFFFMMDEENQKEAVAKDLKSIWKRMEKEKIWVIFENINQKLPVDLRDTIAYFLDKMPENGRALLVGREKPSEEFLSLLWKRKMELVPQSSLNFTLEETAKLTELTGSRLKPGDVYQETGGWAGCVDLMLRLSVKEEKMTAADLMKRYEIRTYISREILGSLKGTEKEIIRRAAVCPWVNEDICRDVWNIAWAGDALENLERKGFLCREGASDHRKIAPLFRSSDRYAREVEKQSPLLWKRLGDWYESHGYIEEMLCCLKKFGDGEAYRAGMLRHYEEIPFLEVSYDQVIEWKSNTPEVCYLKGMYCYFSHDFTGLDREIHKLEKMQPFSGKAIEIYMNLTFAKPDLLLDDWLAMLEKYGKNQNPIRLYNILGGSFTFLCGLRDLSGMFACSRQEEKRKARLWKTYLANDARSWLMLARIDYYIEIGRKKDLSTQEIKSLYTGGGILGKRIR